MKFIFSLSFFFLFTCLSYSQSYSDPCSAFNNPLDGWPNTEFTQEVSGEITGEFPFITENAMGQIQDFSIPGADSSAFIKLNINVNATHVRVRFVTGDAQNLTVGLIRISDPCQNPGESNFGEEVFSTISGDPLIHENFDLINEVVFSLCALSPDDYNNLYIWIASPNGGTEFNLEVTQYIRPTNSNCGSNTQIGRFDINNTYCVTGDNRWSCPSHILDGSNCLIHLSGSEYAVTWYSFTTEDLVNQLVINFNHFNSSDATVAIISPEAGCGGDFLEIMCFRTNDGQITDFQVEVEPNNIYYVLVGTPQNLSRNYELCITAEYVCRSNHGLLTCLCAVEPNCGLDMLDGSCFSMESYSTAWPLFPGCPFNQLDNPHWFSFVAGFDPIVLRLTPLNCVGSGIHFAVYSSTYEIVPMDCQRCNPNIWGLKAEYTHCDCTLNPVDFFIPTIPGRTYYLVIDGCSGSTCDVIFEVLNGGERPEVNDMDDESFHDLYVEFFDDVDTVCVNATGVSVIVIPPSGSSAIEYTFGLAGIPNSIPLGPPGFPVVIPVPDSFFEEEGSVFVCVTALNDCRSSAGPVCKEIVVANVEPYYVIDSVCLGEPYIWEGPMGLILDTIPGQLISGDYFYSDSMFGNYNCKLDMDLNLFVLPSNETEPTVDFAVICPGGSVAFHGVTYNSTGVYTRIIGNQSSCDSFVNLVVLVLEAFVEMAPISCVGEVFTICPGSQLFIPNPGDFNLPGELEVYFEWEHLSTGDILASGTGTNRCLVIHLDELSGDIDSFGLHIYLQYNGEPINPGCYSGPFVAEIKLEDHFPPDTEIEEMEPICVGDTITLSVVDQTDPALYYLWELYGVSPLDYEFLSDNQLANVDIVFFTGGTFGICALAINQCSQGQEGCIDIEVINPAGVFAGEDSTVCDLTYELRSTGIEGFWHAGNRPTGAVIEFSNAENPHSSVTVSDYGQYGFIWTETHPELIQCTSTDTVFILFSEKPFASSVDIFCDSLEVHYFIEFEIGGNADSFFLISGNGTIENGIFTSEPVLSGVPIEIVLGDNNGCHSDTLRFNRNCNCFTSPGNFDSQSVNLCENECIDISIYYDDSTQEYVPGLDTLTYFLFPQNQFNGDESLIIAWNNEGSFCLTSLNIQAGQTVYAFVVLGRAGTDGRVDFNDLCAWVSQGKAITLRSQPSIVMNHSDFNCNLSLQMSASVDHGISEWSFLAGPGAVQFSNTMDPGSTISVSECGIFSLQLSVNNFGCMDSVEVEVEFYCSPELVPGSLLIECIDDENYSVSFEIQNGIPPYSEINDRGTINGSFFDISGLAAGSADVFLITDSNGCILEVSVFRNCDCESFPGQLSPDPVVLCAGEVGFGNGFINQPVFATGNSGWYVLHENPVSGSGDILALNKSGEFDFDQINLVCDRIYLISFVVADSLADGNPDWTDGCLVVSEGHSIIWNCIPQPDAGMDNTSCESSFNLNAENTGYPGSWSSASHSGFQFSAPNNNNTVVTVDQLGQYCFIWTENNQNCTASDTVCIEFLDSPGLLQGSLQIECDGTGDTYSVTFEIENGDAQTYQVSGLGQLTGSVFTSDPISSGDTFYFEISDANNCGVAVVSGQHECDCAASTGELQGDDQILCEDQGINTDLFNYDPSSEVLGSGDLSRFILHSAIPATENNILFQNTSGDFFFDAGAGMEYETTYYLSVGVGPDSGTGEIDFSQVCKDFSTTISIIWYRYPQLEIEAGDLEITCDQPEIEIGVLPDLAFYSYNWQTNNGSIVPGTENQRRVRVNSGGRYFVVVIDDRSGCSTEIFTDVSVSDDIPGVHIAPFTELNCRTDSVILDGGLSSSGPDILHIWDGPGIIQTNTDLNQVVVNVPGLYSLTVVNQISQCSSRLEVQVVQNTDLPIVTAFPDGQLNCSNQTVQLIGEGSSSGSDFQYIWSEESSGAIIVSGRNNINAVASEPGLYRLVVLNTHNGCSDETVIEVIEIDNPIDSISIQFGGNICHGDNDGFILIDEVIGGSPPYTYSFDGGTTFSNNPLITTLTPGNYSIIVKDELGCEFESNILLRSPNLLTVDLGPDLIVNPGERIFLKASTNQDEGSIIEWNWFPAVDASCLNCQEVEFTVLESFILSITVTDTLGCMADDNLFIRVIGDNRLYIPNAFSPNSDGLNDRFGIYTSDGIVEQIIEMRIYDRWGEQLFYRTNQAAGTELNENNSWDGDFNGQPMQSGTYLYYFEIEFTDRRTEVFQGEVMLLR